MFVNTMVLQLCPSSEKTYPGFLSQVKKKTVKVFENQDFEFEDLVEEVNTRRDASRNPLGVVIFLLTCKKCWDRINY